MNPSDLYKIYESIPKSPVKAILITRLIDDTLKVFYEGEHYLIVNVATWIYMEHLLEQLPAHFGLYRLNAREDDDLVRKIMTAAMNRVIDELNNRSTKPD